MVTKTRGPGRPHTHDEQHQGTNVINFGKLAKAKTSAVPATHEELFEQLDRRSTHQILRPVQTEALRGLDTQRSEQDCVLKVSTGSGKTVVGLVYAEIMRRRYPGEPVLFLCPTWQLIDQVKQTATQIGIVAESFPEIGPPLDACEGRSILVCTYDKLFTRGDAFSKWGIVPSAVVMDDVHSGIDKVRQKYTVSIPTVAYYQIRTLFRSIADACDPAVWHAILNNDASARFEVPYWLWQPQASAVAAILEQQREDNDLRFSWQNISRYLEQARLCISGTGAELSLPVPAVEERLAFANAKHRLFMSASIKDGTSLLRDLGCQPEALDRVIEPPSDKGAGERMILPVALIDPKLDKPQIAALCVALSKRVNVVVLTSSAAQSAVWAGFGATACAGGEVDTAVANLRSSSSGHFYAFAQRFDGVDLPDDACRVLVVDGSPIGERMCDQIDVERQKDSPGYNTRTVNRLEQALGRAVRSSADFAAVLLVGADLAAFVGRKDVKDLLEPHTREQIELGKDVAEQLRGDARPIDAIARAVDYLLDRTEAWKDSHRERMASVARSVRGKGLTLLEQAALSERLAWVAVKARNHQGAVAALQSRVDDRSLHEVQRAELMVRMAGYMHQFDPARAATLYRAAFQINSTLPRPPQLPDRRYTQIRQQALLFSEGLEPFATPAAAVAKFEELRARLAYAGSAAAVEGALLELGKLLGATASRPEKETGRGPDVLWIFDDVCFCIEAKNEKSRPIFKQDAEQLLISKQWCIDEAGIAPAQLVSAFATNSKQVDRAEDISFGPKLLTERSVMAVVDSAVGVINGLSFDGPLFRDAAQISRQLLNAKLTGKALQLRLEEF